MPVPEIAQNTPMPKNHDFWIDVIRWNLDDKRLYRGLPRQTANEYNVVTIKRVAMEWLKGFKPAQLGRGSPVAKMIAMRLRYLGWVRKRRVVIDGDSADWQTVMAIWVHPASIAADHHVDTYHPMYPAKERLDA